MSELSSTASSSSSALSGAAKDDDGGEVEVARVLAKLGNTAVNDGGEAADSPSYWGSKAKRSSKRVKTKSDHPEPSHSSGSGLGLDLGLGLGLSLNSTVVPLPFDLNVVQDEGALDMEECHNSVDVHKFCEPAQAAPARCAMQNLGRSRHNLTEAEKEARRIRRVLANRESARQTIRRRQAEHQELTQKAATLASENENLKRRKEMMLTELESLHIMNQNLKEKIGENQEEEQVKASSDMSNATMNLFSRNINQPFLVYNTPTCNPLTFPSCMIVPWPCFVPAPNNVIKNAKDESSIMINRCSWGLAGDDKATAATVTADRKKGSKSSNSKVVKMSKKKVDVDVGVGAEARKRRRELMKLKSNLHCHALKAGSR